MPKRVCIRPQMHMLRNRPGRSARACRLRRLGAGDVSETSLTHAPLSPATHAPLSPAKQARGRDASESPPEASAQEKPHRTESVLAMRWGRRTDEARPRGYGRKPPSKKPRFSGFNGSARSPGDAISSTRRGSRLLRPRGLSLGRGRDCRSLGRLLGRSRRGREQPGPATFHGVVIPQSPWNSRQNAHDRSLRFGLPIRPGPRWLGLRLGLGPSPLGAPDGQARGLQSMRSRDVE